MNSGSIQSGNNELDNRCVAAGAPGSRQPLLPGIYYPVLPRITADTLITRHLY